MAWDADQLTLRSPGSFCNHIGRACGGLQRCSNHRLAGGEGQASCPRRSGRRADHPIQDKSSSIQNDMRQVARLCRGKCRGRNWRDASGRVSTYVFVCNLNIGTFLETPCHQTLWSTTFKANSACMGHRTTVHIAVRLLFEMESRGFLRLSLKSAKNLRVQSWLPEPRQPGFTTVNANFRSPSRDDCLVDRLLHIGQSRATWCCTARGLDGDTPFFEVASEFHQPAGGLRCDVRGRSLCAVNQA